MKPLIWISIIIPVYNVEKYIKKCLDSIVKDNHPFLCGVEVIIVDDGSPDKSGTIADAYAFQYPYIHVIHKANSGVAAARNTGMNAAHGAWIYFMDSDDWLVQGAIEKMQERCKTYHDADILLFDAYQNNTGNETAWEHFDKDRIWDTDTEIARIQRGILYQPMAHSDTRRSLAAPWDKIYRRDFLADHSLRFPESLAVLDDMIFNMEAFGKAQKIVYCKNRIYHYRYVPDSITNAYKPDRVQQDMAVWKHIEQYMASQTQLPDKEQFRQAFYCRVVKSFSICCRLCFFHIKNEKSLAGQIAYVKYVMASEPYQTAFGAVQIRYAQWKLKIMILVCRCGWGYGVWLLHKAQTVIRHVQ